MALSAVLLATIVALVVATGAFFTGHVGLWGAIGLYIGAGWAAIIALSLASTIGGTYRRSSHLAADAPQAVKTGRSRR